MDTNAQKDKWKQREALENCYFNFLEPHVNQFIEVNTQSLTTVPIASSGLYCTSGWLLLTLLYCIWMRWQGKNEILRRSLKNRVSATIIAESQRFNEETRL